MKWLLWPICFFILGHADRLYVETKSVWKMKCQRCGRVRERVGDEK